MKILIFLFTTLVFGISWTNDAVNKTITSVNVGNKHSVIQANNRTIDFILGNWVGTGFVTDANGLQQYIEIKETNTSLSNSQFQIIGTGKNPGNDFVYAYNKVLYFNTTMNQWFTKSTINGQILPDSHTILGENNIFSYSYYDSNSVLVRHSTYRDTDDSFTEIQEKWGHTGWDRTASFRMTRMPNN